MASHATPGEQQLLIPRSPQPSPAPSPPQHEGQDHAVHHHPHKKTLTTLDLAKLTVCMAGVQFAWTVELGYGTLYLLSLGIPKAMTPLVWLAGPLSGLVIQPLVGVFSDSLDWRLGRRRPFIFIGAALTILSMIVIAYAHDLATAFVNGTNNNNSGDIGGGPQEQDRHGSIQTYTIVLAVIGFYGLDFSINAVQASCRSLIMDIPPTDQQEVGNAWSGWMNNLGSVIGFFSGQLNLVKMFPFLGNEQIKVLANMSILFFSLCLSITCLSVHEIPYVKSLEDTKQTVFGTISNIWKAFRHLPMAIQRLCNVQFFAWMGWFPFLFYGTAWVAEVHHRRGEPETDPTVVQRAGSFALLCWAVVALISGILIPKLTPQEFGHERWPKNPFTLKNLWTMSLIWFAACMGMTFFVEDIIGASIVIALCGVPWAMVMWIPYAMVGEYVGDLKDLEEEVLSSATTVTAVIVAAGSAPASSVEPTTYDPEIGSGLARQRAKRLPVDIGLTLGVHNMYLVFPQFVDALIVSILFALLGPPGGIDAPPRDDDDEMVRNYEPIGWVLRFGGLMALFAAYLCWKTILPRRSILALQ